MFMFATKLNTATTTAMQPYAPNTSRMLITDCIVAYDDIVLLYARMRFTNININTTLPIMVGLNYLRLIMHYVC